MVNEIIQQILDSGKITQEELDKKIDEKMKALSGLISQEGAAHIVAGELGIQTDRTASSNAEVKLKDLTPTMKSVHVFGKVLKKYELRIFGEDHAGKVGSLLMGDETGLSRLTFWNDKCQYFDEIQEGDIIEVQNAYAKENNGRVELHMGNSSNCILNPEGKSIVVAQKQEYKEEIKRIKEITANDTYVDVMATIVQVYDPRFFETCPTCNKRMQIANEGKFSCAEHGLQEPAFNYVMNIFLDDGSDNIRATLWKEQIQQLLNLSDEEIIKLKDDASKIEEIKNDLLGKIVKIRAKVKNNEAFNQLELVIYKIDSNPQPIEEKPIISTPNKESKKASEEAPQSQSSTTEEMMGEEEIFDIEDLEDESQ